MLRTVILLAAAATVACGRSEKAAPTPAASASSSVTVTHAASSASAASATATASSGFPPVERECAKDADCEAVYFHEDCCPDCAPRVGNRAWASKVKKTCGSREGGTKNCIAHLCTMAFGKPRCNAGQCVLR